MTKSVTKEQGKTDKVAENGTVTVEPENTTKTDDNKTYGMINDVPVSKKEFLERTGAVDNNQG